MALEDPRDGAVYAALNLGHFGVKLHRSEEGGVADAGATWTGIAAPTYPRRTDEEKKAGEAFPKAAPWPVQQIWSMEPGGADEPGVLWAGTIPRDSRRFPNCGRRRVLARGFRGGSLGLRFRGCRASEGSGDGVTTGSLWVSEDQGDTWQSLSALLPPIYAVRFSGS